MNKKIMQIIINIITIINIVAILIIIYVIIVNNKYSRKVINELVEKNTNIINYIIIKQTYCAENEKISTQKIIQNENGRKEENLDNNHTILYYNDFRINLNDKIYSKFVGHKIDENGNIECIDVTTKDVISWHILKNEYESFSSINSSSDYKYLKKEQNNDKICIVIELNPIDNETIKIWIDLETGLIKKEEYYMKNKLSKRITYETAINKVTDDNLCVPNLKYFNYIEEREKI